MTVPDPMIAFIDFMRSVDCGPAPEVQINADDTMHRFRLDGDRPKTLNGSYILRVDADGFAVGGCMNFRHQTWHKWHTKSARKASEQDRAAWKAKADTARAKQDQDRAAEVEAAALKAKSIWAGGEKDGVNAYLERKGFTAAAIGCRMSRGSVVVPLWSADALVGLQFIDGDGDKLFLKGCAKEGAYHAMPGDGDLILIGEGLATMAALRAALGCSVIVAFDAGNLKPVARLMRKKYPDKRIVIAADGDQWTVPAGKRPDDWDNPAGDDQRWIKWRADGLCVNTGADRAAQAAVAIGGAVVVAPPFQADDAGKRTDWWDYWIAHGSDGVKAAFETAFNLPSPPEYHEADRWFPDSSHNDPDAVIEAGAGWRDNPILQTVRPLGRNGKNYYFFPRSAGQILEYSGPALANMQTLVGMAPRSLWEANFDAKGGEKKMASEASLMLIEACSLIGIYDHEQARGVGVWMDDGIQVFNAGDKIYWPDGECQPPDYKSKNVYVMAGRIGGLVGDRMTNAEGGEILKICLFLSWKSRAAGYMLAGWIVTSIIGGALRWRSHVVITGEKGSGKSWVIEAIIKPLLGRIALARDGGSTEAGIRKDIGGTARPIIMDEGESETARDRANMESIFMLARKASSGSTVANFNGNSPIRSSFCFAAINPRLIQGADLDRNTILQLTVNRSDSASSDFKDLRRRVSAAISDEAAGRLFARLFHNIPTILKNVETFSDVLEEQEGSKRFGDQFGTLVAGAFALTSTAEISREHAMAWCANHDWRWAKSDNEESDSERLLQYILSARIRYDDRGMTREASVGRLIDRARNGDGMDRDAAICALGEYGMKLDGEWFCIASPCTRMGDVLRETAWAGSYRRSLGELPGAEQRNPIRFNSSLRARAVALPLNLVFYGDNPIEEELPFDGWS